MPALSKTQQRLMGQALAYKRGDIKNKDLNPQYADEIKKIAKSMSEKKLRDFAKTKHKNLPEKVKESLLDNKFKHIKEFKRFLNESSNEQENVLKWWNSLDITLQIALANEYSANFDIIETIPYDEILNIYRNEMNLTKSSIPGDTGKSIENPYYKELTKEEKRWLEAMISHADDRIGFEPNDIKIKNSIFSKLEIN